MEWFADPTIWLGLLTLILLAHEDFSIPRTLNLFKRAPVEMAIVVDEYGELQGIVTQTDLLEAIAGHLPQADNEQPDIEERAGGVLLANGATPIFDVQTRLGLESLPSGDFDTVAGLVLHLSGRIPAVGDAFEWEGWELKVLHMDVYRIVKVRIQRMAAAVSEASASTEEPM